MSAEAPDLLDMLDEITAERWDCGRHRRDLMNDLIEHGAECWGGRCPHCDMTFTYPLDVSNHDPFGPHFEREGTCFPQRWMFERQACCLACKWPTFGRWPCRNEACELHVPETTVTEEER